MAALIDPGRSRTPFARALLAIAVAAVALAVASRVTSAQPPTPGGIEITPGCRQYLLEWNPVTQAAFYRVYVIAPPETLEVTGPSAVLVVNSAPTDRDFRVAAVDDEGIEGGRSGRHSAQGAGLVAPDIIELAPILVRTGMPLSIDANTVSGSGQPPAPSTFTWRRDGALLPYTGSHYYTGSAQFSDSGLYVVSGCSPCCDTTDLVRVTVRPPNPPTPSLQAIEGCQGNDLTWNAGPSAVAFEIHRTSAPDTIVTGTAMFDPVPPGTCRSYSIRAIDAWGQVSNLSGSTQSRCPVEGPPSGLSLGPDRALLSGSPLMLSVTGEWGDEPVTFRYYQGSTLRATWSQPYWSLPAAYPSDAGTYRCEVENLCGTRSVSLNVFVVDSPPMPQWVAIAPACSSIVVTWPPVEGIQRYLVERYPQPFGGFVFADDTTYVDRAFFDEGYNPVTPVRYMIHSVVHDSLIGWNIPSEAEARPAVAARIEVQPTGGRYEEGNEFVLRCTTAPDNAVVVWRKDGVPLDPQPAYPNEWGVQNSQPSHAGSYDVVVTTECGSVTSAPAVIQVCRTPRVTTLERNYWAEIGTPLYSIASDAQGADSLRWFRNGVLLADGRLQGATLPVLSISNVASGDAGFYELRAYGSCDMTVGPRIQLATAVCVGAPQFSEQSSGSQLVQMGQTVTLKALATSCRPLSFQWAHRAPGWGSWRSVEGGTSPTLSVSIGGPTDGGEYRCYVQGYRWAQSEISYLTLLPAARTLSFALTQRCAPTLGVSWVSDQPAVATVRRVYSNCSYVSSSTEIFRSGLVTSGTFNVPSGAYFKFALTNLSNVTYEFCSGYTGITSQGYPTIDIAAQPYYLTIGGVRMLPIVFAIRNRGCTSISGPFKLTSMALSGTGVGTPVLFSGASALPFTLGSTSIGTMTTSTSHTVYIPVTSPPLQAEQRVLSGSFSLPNCPAYPTVSFTIYAWLPAAP